MTFDEWTRTGLQRLLRFATALCGSGHLAEDVVQDVAIKAQRNWSRRRRRATDSPGSPR